MPEPKLGYVAMVMNPWENVEFGSFFWQGSLKPGTDFGIGFMRVYATMEEAEKYNPGVDVFEVELRLEEDGAEVPVMDIMKKVRKPKARRDD
jgi:hypothetical protein